jgi:hypothetical protein
MHRVRQDDRNDKDGGFPRTTTWGAVIALSLVLLALDFAGPPSLFVGAPPGLQANAGGSFPDPSVSSEFTKLTNAVGKNRLGHRRGCTCFLLAAETAPSLSSLFFTTPRADLNLQAGASSGARQDPAAQPAVESGLPFGSPEDREAQNRFSYGS